MTGVVLDASVVIAAIMREPGGDRAVGHATQPMVSAVNYAEVRSRLTDLGMTAAGIDQAFEMLNFDIVGFDREHADRVAELRPLTRPAGLSLGDRACLALALARDAVALTADRDWQRVALPLQVDYVR